MLLIPARPCVASAICAVALVGVMTACASRGEQGANVAGGVASSVSQPQASTSIERPEPNVADGQLVSPISFEEGNIVLQAPGGTAPPISAEQALAAFTKTGLYSSELANMSPQTFLAAMTSYARSTKVSEDGRLVPDTRDHLVWIVYFHDVPSAPSGPGGYPGHPPKEAPPGLEDVLAIDDAQTGQLEDVLTTVADPTTLNLDQGPLVSNSKPAASSSK
jgi:hypothetical protein